MAPAVGSTEMRYCGISLLRTLDSSTIALWPEVPTGGVPHRMSLGCADADEIAAMSARAPANAFNATLRMMAFLQAVLLVLNPSQRLQDSPGRERHRGKRLGAERPQRI